ncbi:MAG: glycosyltransferase family 4 protein [Coxiellaceae bacterium]|nr:glycosyltransferase family 4 protein [Coxiellaceae bacterium]
MHSALLIAAFIFSLSFTGLFRKFALQKAIIDLPNERSAHVIPTPRGGGLVFTVAFYGLLVTLWFLNEVQTPLFLSLLGGIVVAIVGYWDDLYHLKIQWRFLGHCIAAVWGIAWLPIPHGVDTFLAIFLTVWFINLYNFMDGIDGVAASEAIFVSVAAGIALLHHDAGVSTLCFGLGAIMLGFLCWNWAPAKIFMGDVGSGFLGYCFAILMWATAAAHSLSILFWWILLAVFLVDATFTLLRRMIQGKKWYQAHCEHGYQKLTQKGLSHAKVTLCMMGINIFILLPAAFFLS